jgi:hypothetical protein
MILNGVLRTLAVLAGFTFLLVGCDSAGERQTADDSAAPLTQSDAAIDWQYQMAYQRGIEAMTWGIPAVGIMTMRDAAFSLGGGFNTVYFMGKPPTPRSEALTANNQTPYANLYLTTIDGPVVLDIPPATAQTAIFGSAVDVWQIPVADIGPAGTDQGQGGKYLFLPPGYEGDVPEGYFEVPMDTYGIFVALRCIPLADTTFEEAAEYAKQINAYPLASAGAPPAGEYIDIWDQYLPTLPEYDLSFFEYLAELVNSEPLLERDMVMGGMLASIGIEKGKSFAPQGVTRDALEKAASDGYDYLEYLFETPGYSFEQYWPDRQWYGIAPPSEDGFVFHEGDTLLIDARGSLFHWATFFPRQLGKASAYLAGLHDTDGVLLQGDAVYRLTVPADVPARDFWSVIAYSKKTKAFIYNDLNRVGLSSYDKPAMTVNADGSVDIYLGAEPPAGLESNWIPSAGQDFFLLFRFYGPEESLFDKSFVLPDIERID